VAEDSPISRPRDELPGGGSAADSAVVSRGEVVDALLVASRALVAIAARSLAGQGVEVTLPQFRALVVLRSRGPQRVVDISRELGVDPSAGTRLCDRLVRKGLVRRQRSTTDRRVVRVVLTPTGQSLVDQVTLRRREELTRIVQEIREPWPEGATRALHAFASVAGEDDEQSWWMGWQVVDPDVGDPGTGGRASGGTL
jgi:DNA-binding MarR family transcriptional regulator